MGGSEKPVRATVRGGKIFYFGPHGAHGVPDGAHGAPWGTYGPMGPQIQNIPPHRATHKIYINSLTRVFRTPPYLLFEMFAKVTTSGSPGEPWS